MKTHFFKAGPIILLLVLSAASINHIHAQCPGSLAPVTLTFDTIGRGTGNDSYSFALPKFDPSLGMLTAVTISSNVKVNYVYSIGNTRSASALYKTRILRTDDITSTALDPSSISQATQTPLLNTTVAGNTTVQVGPLIMSYTVSQVVNNGTVVNFMGAGTVDFTYDNTSYVAFSGPSGSNVDFTQLIDTLLFRVAYTFCPSSALALNLFSFTAVKKNNDAVQLGWQQLHEEKNRTYTVQESTDGKEFKNITEVPANATGMYSYIYPYTPAFSKKLFFRIIQKDNQSASYSAIRVIDCSDKNISSGMHIFPSNPTDKMVIVFNKQDNRKITLYTIAGQPIQTNTYTNAATVRIIMPSNLQKGIYIVEAVNMHTQEREVSKILIQ
jgi:Secretion system C-terminal sorting domain